MYIRTQRALAVGVSVKYSIIKTGYIIIDVEKNNKVIAVFYDKKIAQSFINLLNGLN